MRNEEIGEVSGPIEIERVIDDSDGRVYERKGVELFILDGTYDTEGDAFLPECELIYANPVPIINGAYSEAVIGAADLYREGKSLMADLFIMYDSQERLILETGAKLWATAYGQITKQQPIKGGRISIYGMHITGVILGNYRNPDPRIASL